LKNVRRYTRATDSQMLRVKTSEVQVTRYTSHAEFERRMYHLDEKFTAIIAGQTAARCQRTLFVHFRTFCL